MFVVCCVLGASRPVNLFDILMIYLEEDWESVNILCNILESFLSFEGNRRPTICRHLVMFRHRIVLSPKPKIVSAQQCSVIVQFVHLYYENPYDWERG